MNVLLIDNYDSFTFNLYQLVGELLNDLFPDSIFDVVRNDEASSKKLRSKDYDKIIISPGPGNPADPKYFGVCKEVIIDLAKTIPTLGVCLGLQGIAYYYGGQVVQAAQPMHGKTSFISHDGKGVFDGIPNEIKAMRYHSLVVDPRTLPDCLEISARVVSPSNTGEIMGLRHRIYPLEGVQFHPESFATDYGKKLITNFLEQKI
jgi:anthranilate synthase/aminodeoxychorismate synthase-like glutamine amidotransferase